MHVYKKEVVILDVGLSLLTYLVKIMTNIVELCKTLNYDKELTIGLWYITSFFSNLYILNNGSVCALEPAEGIAQIALCCLK